MSDTKNQIILPIRQPLPTRLLQTVLFPSKTLSIRQKQKLADHIAGKTILITGASYGIGEQLAYLLAELNNINTDNPTRLILVGRTLQKLEYVQARINSASIHAQIYALDLRDEAQLQDFISYLQSQSVDIFVNNAGQSIKRSIIKSLDRAHDYERTIKLNYLSPVKLSLSLIPQLIANNGQIINVSALNVLLPPMPEWSAYQASKTAFDQWFNSVSPELYAQGVTCSTLYLPLVRTRMIAPTAMYQTAPAMTPDQVATLIARLILTQKTHFKPWWLYPAELLSVLFRRPLAFAVRSFYRYKSSHSYSKLLPVDNPSTDSLFTESLSTNHGSIDNRSIDKPSTDRDL